VRIGLIGASGFIGLRVTELFTQWDDFELVPLVRAPGSLAVLARQRLPWRIHSFVHIEDLTRGLEGLDACVHAAIGDAAQIKTMAATAYEACARAGVKRLVWLSSASVHDQNPAPGTDEASPLQFKSRLSYNRAKAQAEARLLRLQEDGRVEVVRLRPSVVFGPRSRWIADSARELEAGTACWVGHGEGICNTVYVDNLVHAVARALLADGAAGKAFFIGDREKVTWRMFQIAIARHLGFGEEVFAPIQAAEVPPEKDNLLNRITLSPAYGQISRRIPDRLRLSIKQVRAALQKQAPASSWVRPARPARRISSEMMLLQRCEWQLPSQRAEKEIGYAPPFSFEEGMRRSLAWLDFTR
jgi:nucleoside-diphosphate-sugar epimerase